MEQPVKEYDPWTSPPHHAPGYVEPELTPSELGDPLWVPEPEELWPASEPENVIMSDVWRGLPMDILLIVIDYLCQHAREIYDYEEREEDPVLWDNGQFSDRAQKKTWNKLLAVGGEFTAAVLRELIRTGHWHFDSFDTFCLAIHSWDVVIPGSWNQLRVLHFDKVKSDGSNSEDLIDMLAELPKFTNLRRLVLIFECVIDTHGRTIRYFDDKLDLDESSPDVFQALEATRLPEVSIFGINFSTVPEYLRDVITGKRSPFVLKEGQQPPWRREFLPDPLDWGANQE